MNAVFCIRFTFYITIIINICFAEGTNKKMNLSDLRVGSQGSDKNSTTITVKETNVYINDIPYNQIEYQNQFFYLKLSSPLEEPEDCLLRPKGPPPPDRIQFILGNSEIKSRSQLFINALNVKCGEVVSWDSFISKIKDIKIGINIPDQKDDTIKDKKIYTTPALNSLNLNGSF